MLDMKESMLMERKIEKVNLLLLKEAIIKDIGQKVICMGKECTCWQMAASMKESTSMIKQMVMVYALIEMDDRIKDNGPMISNMEREYQSDRSELNIMLELNAL